MSLVGKRGATPPPKRPWLPDPNQLGDSATEIDFIAANSAVEKLDETESSWKKKRGLYQVYDAITKLAEENGLARATEPIGKKATM